MAAEHDLHFGARPSGILQPIRPPCVILDRIPKTLPPAFPPGFTPAATARRSDAPEPVQKRPPDRVARAEHK